ncbi:MAG: hypothetical protein ACREMS_01190 [Gemmatimonadaceae bacterium]
MNSELGMLLPFAFVMFVVWNGSRILLARLHARSTVPADIDRQLKDLAARIEQLEQAGDLNAAELQRLAEAERFTTRLLSEHVEDNDYQSLSRPTV